VYRTQSALLPQLHVYVTLLTRLRQISFVALATIRYALKPQCAAILSVAMAKWIQIISKRAAVSAQIHSTRIMTPPVDLAWGYWAYPVILSIQSPARKEQVAERVAPVCFNANAQSTSLKLGTENVKSLMAKLASTRMGQMKTPPDYATELLILTARDSDAVARMRSMSTNWNEGNVHLQWE
jgi:hypothetical protein